MPDPKQLNLFDRDRRSEADTEVLADLTADRLTQVATLLAARANLHAQRIALGIIPPDTSYALTGEELDTALQIHGLHIQVEEAR